MLTLSPVLSFYVVGVLVGMLIEKILQRYYY